jgi:ElaB/YqjD/DUF883 family membrane-anchored ribosome-binding protein
MTDLVIHLSRSNAMKDLNLVTKEKLIADFKVVLADTEELLRATAGQAGDKISELRGKAQDRLSRARIMLAEAEGLLVDRAKEAGQVADTYVRDNPWRAVGVAAGFGFIVGLLIGRR